MSHLFGPSPLPAQHFQPFQHGGDGGGGGGEDHLVSKDGGGEDGGDSGEDYGDEVNGDCAEFDGGGDGGLVQFSFDGKDGKKNN